MWSKKKWSCCLFSQQRLELSSITEWNYWRPMISTDFLGQIEWEERTIELEAEGQVNLPAYAGSTIRGALGTVLRPELCGRNGNCGEECGNPEGCPFYSLFEQSRGQNGRGSNIPKPLVLDAPCGEPLRAIAVGATVARPYVVEASRPIPLLSNDWRIGVEEGQRVKVTLRGLGAAGAALDGAVEGVRRHGLEVAGGVLRLVGVTGTRARFALPREVEKRDRLRLGLVTPTLIKQGEAVCKDPQMLGRLVLDQAVIRAVSIYNAFFAKGGQRIPFVEPEWPGVAMTASRLFFYHLPRKSYRQGREMNFDGPVGWLEWEGETAQILPWLRAAEILHIGQKATFGLGRVELLPVLSGGVWEALEDEVGEGVDGGAG
jgi:hypothetical protein